MMTRSRINTISLSLLLFFISITPTSAGETLQPIPVRNGVPSSALNARQVKKNIDLAKRELENVFRSYRVTAKPAPGLGPGLNSPTATIFLVTHVQNDRLDAITQLQEPISTSQDPAVQVRRILEGRQGNGCNPGSSPCATRPDKCCKLGKCCPSTPYCYSVEYPICCPAIGTCKEGQDCCTDGKYVPSGDVCCPGTNKYCSRGYRCCPGGGCAPPGGTCCGGTSCTSDEQCCGGQMCVPKAAKCCGTDHYCESGERCCLDAVGGPSCCKKGSTCCSDSKHCCSEPFGKCCSYTQENNIFCWKPQSECPSCPNSRYSPCSNSDYSRSTCCPPEQTCCIGTDRDRANFNQPFCALDCSVIMTTTKSQQLTSIRNPTNTRARETRTRARTTDECGVEETEALGFAKRQDIPFDHSEIEYSSCPIEIPVWECDLREFPQACANVASAIAVNKATATLTYGGPSAQYGKKIRKRRRTAQSPWRKTHNSTWNIAGCDIDEYPPAISKEGGGGPSSTVRYIPGRVDNQKSGSNMWLDIKKVKVGNTYRSIRYGDTFKVTVVGLSPDIGSTGDARGWLLEKNPCGWGKGDGPGFALKGYIKPGTTVHGLTPGVNYENDKWWDTIPENQRVGFWLPRDNAYQASKKGRELVGNYISGFRIEPGIGGSTKKKLKLKRAEQDEDYGDYYRHICLNYDIEFDPCDNYITGNNTGCQFDIEEANGDGYNDPDIYLWPDMTPIPTVDGTTLCADPVPSDALADLIMPMPMPTCRDGSLAIWDPASERTYCGLKTDGETFGLSICQSLIAEANGVAVPGEDDWRKNLPTCGPPQHGTDGDSGSGASMPVTAMWWLRVVHVVLCVFLPLVVFVCVHG